MKAKRIALYTIKYALLAVLTAVLAFNCVIFVMSVSGQKPGRYVGRFLTVTTGSMEPDLCAGDLIYIRHVPMEQLEIGDVVTVVKKGTVVTHAVHRIGEGRIVTKGTVNALEDTPSVGEDYLGRMEFRIAGGGQVYDVITSAPVCIGAAVLILLVFFAKPLILLLTKKKEKIRIGLLRAVGAATAVSCFLLPPASTLARYTALLSAGKTAGAAEVNFDSNFLSANTSYYTIVGWNGKDYNIDFRVLNFSNSLKCNEEGIDLPYTVTIAKDESTGFASDYSLKLEEQYVETMNEDNGEQVRSSAQAYVGEPDIRVKTGNEKDELYRRTGVYTLPGGAPTSHVFRLTVNGQEKDENGKYDAQSPVALNEGDKIRFTIETETKDGAGFIQKLSAEYTFQLTKAEDFLDSYTIQEVGNSLVKVTMKSATLIGIEARDIRVDWDPSVIYLNTYETNTWNKIQSGEITYDEEDGYMTFRMPATSSMTFELYKRSTKLNIVLDQRHEVVEANHALVEHISIFAQGNTPPVWIHE